MDQGSILQKDIEEAQSLWAEKLINIGNKWQQGLDHKTAAREMVDSCYGYNHDNRGVLFKPTLAREQPFRPTRDSAISYFIGGDDDFNEDKGFALKPWAAVSFANQCYYYHGDMAVVMGKCNLTDNKGQVTSVEYTLGYMRDKGQRLKIFLHHSSLPYAGQS